MKGHKARMPDYYKHFKCTEDKCRNNCCQHNWVIIIDKETYDSYKKLGKEECERIRKNIKVTDENPFNAHIVMDESGKCSLLEKNGLCNIHKNYGPEYLSNTCRIYPRLAFVIDGKLEGNLSLSCEAVSELVLFLQEPIRLEDAILAHDAKGRVIYEHTLSTNKFTSAKNSEQIFHKLRDASISIMQLRDYSVRFRMLLLCLFIQEVDVLISSEQDSLVMQTVDDFLQRVKSGFYAQLASEFPNGADISTDVILGILKEMSQKRDRQFRECFENALEGHGFSTSSPVPPDDFVAIFNENRAKYFSDKEHILENYIVCTILSDGFPFNYKNDKSDTSLMMSYAGLLAKYDMIEFLLVGTCRYNGKFDRIPIIDCVSFFCKLYEHSRKGYLNYG